MKKIVFVFLMIVAYYFIGNGIDSPIAFAQNVRAYTDSRGWEYYVKTETVRAGDASSRGWYDRDWWFVDVLLFKPEKNSLYTYTYVFTYYKNTGAWTGSDDPLGREYPLQNEKHPELYSIWEIALEYF